jgi:hypothetical protein
MAEYSKKFKNYNKEYDRGKRKDYSQEFEYKRKDVGEQSEEYVEKNTKPANPEPTEPEMREAEPETRQDFPKKKRGSAFGFNSSFGNRSGKFGGQDRWANDKKSNDDDEAQDGAPNEQNAGEFSNKQKYPHHKAGYKKENLTYYERKHTTEQIKTEPEYYKSTNFDLPEQNPSTKAASATPINWNTQNKRRQDTDSDEYEGDQNYRRDDGYYRKPAYKQNYKTYEEHKRPEYQQYSKHREQNYQEYPESQKSYKNSGDYQVDYYNDKKYEKGGDRSYQDRSYKAGSYNNKQQDRKYNNSKYRQDDYDHQYDDKGIEESKPIQPQAPLPERRMGGREFKLPTPEDLKKDVVEPKKKEVPEKHQGSKPSASEDPSRKGKPDASDKHDVKF